ncbi:MAG: hypothetical protein V1726_04320 [Methanobacteriota archaeon]
MRKILAVGSISAVVLIICAMFPSIVSAQSIQSQKIFPVRNLILSKLKSIRETRGMIGGVITIVIAFLIWIYIGVATGNDVVINFLVKIISSILSLSGGIFLYILGWLFTVLYDYYH